VGRNCSSGRRACNQHGQPERAIELYGQCVEREPERAEAYYKRANALNGLGRLEPALEDYDRAIRFQAFLTLMPSATEGLVLERLGRREEGASQLRSRDRVGSQGCV